MSDQSPALSILGLPGLARALAAAQVPAVSGDYTRDDIAAAAGHASSGIPLLLGAADIPGLADWVADLARQGIHVLVVGSLPRVDPSLLVDPSAPAASFLDQLGIPTGDLAPVTLSGQPLPAPSVGPPLSPQAAPQSAASPAPMPQAPVVQSAPSPTPRAVWDPRFPSGGTGATRRVWVTGVAGGVGTTAVALAIAHHAGSLRLDTALVDFADGHASFDAANGDTTISDLADARATGDGADALTSADSLRAARGGAVGSVDFALLASPLGGTDLDGPLAATALQAASAGRHMVVVDAGKPLPGTPLWTLVEADARAGGWILVLARPDHFSCVAADRLFTDLSLAQIPPDRVLAAFTFCHPAGPDPAGLARGLGPATWLDPVSVDEAVALNPSRGHVGADGTALAPLAARVTWLATGAGDNGDEPRGRVSKKRKGKR